MHRRDDFEAGGMTTFSNELRPHAAPPGETNGFLSLQRCQSCGRYPTYPRIRCPVCLGELRWVNATGSGSVVDFALVHRPQDVRYEPYLPIVLAHIALSEGVEVIATIVGQDRLKSQIGDPVVVSGQRGWSTLQQFELSKGGPE
jgi:uncharacterized OB-fold protein